MQKFCKILSDALLNAVWNKRKWFYSPTNELFNFYCGYLKHFVIHSFVFFSTIFVVRFTENSNRCSQTGFSALSLAGLDKKFQNSEKKKERIWNPQNLLMHMKQNELHEIKRINAICGFLFFYLKYCWFCIRMFLGTEKYFL